MEIVNKRHKFVTRAWKGIRCEFTNLDANTILSGCYISLHSLKSISNAGISLFSDYCTSATKITKIVTILPARHLLTFS